MNAIPSSPVCPSSSYQQEITPALNGDTVLYQKVVTNLNDKIGPINSEDGVIFELKDVDCIEKVESVSETLLSTANVPIYDTSNFLIRNISQQELTVCVANANDSTLDKENRASNYIFQILNKTYDGNFQIAAYDFECVENNRQHLLETKNQTYFSKTKIAKLVIDHEVWKTKNYHISPDRLMELALCTSQLFPGYLPESFYCRGSAKKSAGGNFQIRYSRIREKEIAIGRLQPYRQKRKLSEIDVESEDLQKIRVIINIIDDEYIKLWSTTAVAERRKIYKEKELSKIAEKFPSLQHPTAYELIQSDFCNFFNKSIDLFKRKWTQVSSEIIALAKTKNKDADIKEVLSTNKIIKNEEHQKNVALVLLPLLFKRTTKVTAKSKTNANWVPQKKEILMSFIIHLKDSQNLQSTLKDAHDNLLLLYNDHKLIIRPYVVICGPSLSEIETAFVIAHPFKYQFTSASQAVDICFKLMKVLEEPYSAISNHVWQFLEKKIYEFNVHNLYAGVTTILEKLK